MRIDSHQHFWTYHAEQYGWIQESWPIRRSFGPSDLMPLLDEAKIDGCIAVQARQSIEETEWLLGLATLEPRILGIVGWVDLQSEQVEEQLRYVSHNPKLKGVRHVVQDEPDDNFMLGEAFHRGIDLLKKFDLAYDILVYPKQLPAAIELVKRFPQQRFVLDHLAKPFIKTGVMEPWRSHIKELAAFPNVYCKVSGMVTEASWKEWKKSDFNAYLQTAFDCFGQERLMYGSDWPVALLSASYAEVIGLAEDFFSRLSDHDRSAIFGGNAATFYKVS